MVRCCDGGVVCFGHCSKFRQDRLVSYEKFSTHTVPPSFPASSASHSLTLDSHSPLPPLHLTERIGGAAPTARSHTRKAHRQHCRAAVTICPLSHLFTLPSHFSYLSLCPVSICRAQRQAEEPVIKALEKENSELTTQLRALVSTHTTVREEAAKLKQTAAELEVSHKELALKVATEQKECERLRAQIVRSPERMKKVGVWVCLFVCCVVM